MKEKSEKQKVTLKSKANERIDKLWHSDQLTKKI